MPVPHVRHIRRRPDTAWRVIEGRAAVVTVRDSTLHTLNEVGTRVWQLARGDRRIAEIVGVLCGEYEAERDAVERDVDAFVEEMMRRGMLEASDEPWAPEPD